MELLLERIAKKSQYTIGKLSIDGEYFCDTIEDTDRGLSDSMSYDEIKKIKINSETAIPTGKYEVTMKIKSPRFSKKKYYRDYCDGYLPRLLNVKCFEGILIHIGNTASDSSGCILVGKNTQVGKVLNSKITFEKLYTTLKSASDNGEKIFITIH